MTKMPESDVKLSEQLRRIVDAWPESRYRIAQETGISESMLSRFMSGSRGLSMEAMDTLGTYFGLEFKAVRRKRSR